MSALAHYIEEEIGHQEWILNDIKACGGDAEAVRRSQPKVGRNEPCPCGSNKKYKKCCGG